MHEKLVGFDGPGFVEDLLGWYAQEKRDLPWRHTRDPYCIWVSESMLQQTRVDTVIPYYQAFLQAFPTVQALAEAPVEAVLKQWEGLGFYSRARNLHKAAAQVVACHGGKMPMQYEDMRALAGVGEYTAGAVMSIAYGMRVPAVDGNVLRVMSRLLNWQEDIMKPPVRAAFRQALGELLPGEQAMPDFTQAMMELGALICTPKSPACLVCPVRGHCRAQHADVQESLPVKAAPRKPRDINMAVVLAFKGDAVLVRRRAQEGLLGGLYEFPFVEGDGDKNPLAAWGLEGAYLCDLGDKKHVFTHLVWHMHAQQWHVTGGQAPQGYAFASAKELGELPIPTAMAHWRKIAMALLEEGKI
nr:A/G-specific adenine glycosylase [bacterium]